MKIPRSYKLETPRCHLCAPSRDEIPHIFAATRYQGFNDGMLWEPPETQAELEKPLIDGMRAWESGTAFSFSIILKKSAAFIGRIAIRKERESGVWNIGFWTHPEYQGQGYMTEVAQVILAFGFIDLGATRIEACHALWNKASARVLAKIGMQFVRYIPKGFLKEDNWVEENLLAIDLSEWEEAHILIHD